MGRCVVWCVVVALNGAVSCVVWCGRDKVSERDFKEGLTARFVLPVPGPTRLALDFGADKVRSDRPAVERRGLSVSCHAHTQVVA
jgi:hypothetical protein